MSEEEFIELFAGCASDVIDKDFPKNDTASSGGAQTPGRGAAVVDSVAICLALTSRLRERGFFAASLETRKAPGLWNPEDGGFSVVADLLTRQRKG